MNLEVKMGKIGFRSLAKDLSLLCHYLLLFDGRFWNLSTQEEYDVGEV